MNDTLKKWVPKIEALDELLDADQSMRIVKIDDFSAVYAAYQSPALVTFNLEANGISGKEEEALSYTFEDALVLANIETFRNLEGVSLIGKFREAISGATNVRDLTQKFHAAVRGSDKGKFALDVIFGVEPSALAVPGYIHAGLVWLEKQLASRDERSLVARGVTKDGQEEVNGAQA